MQALDKHENCRHRRIGERIASYLSTADVGLVPGARHISNTKAAASRFAEEPETQPAALSNDCDRPIRGRCSAPTDVDRRAPRCSQAARNIQQSNRVGSKDSRSRVACYLEESVARQRMLGCLGAVHDNRRDSQTAARVEQTKDTVRAN